MCAKPLGPSIRIQICCGGGFVGTGVCFFNGFRGVGFEKQTNDGLVCLREEALTYVRWFVAKRQTLKKS